MFFSCTSRAEDRTARGQSLDCTAMPGRRPSSPEANNHRPRLLVLASAASLYGADRCLLAAMPSLVDAFDVTLALPQDGPAVELFEQSGARVLHLPDYTLRPIYFTPIGALRWFSHAFRSTVRLTLSLIHI